MNQSAEPNNDRSAEPDKGSDFLAGKHVCPFCGVVRADPLLPCPRCTMEDSPATRTATQARIGPWFVLQTRNPAAPGMKFSTLASLVKKGHVTARSIVRGPTTQQFWTFASRVRGLSRELGLCYHCGNAIAVDIVSCPQCNRPQEVPGDSDLSMLELTETRHPIVREVPMSIASSDTIAADQNLEHILSLGSSHIGAGTGNTRRPNSSLRMPEKHQEDPILSARELAAAFQLEIGMPTGKKPSRMGQFLRAIATILVLIALPVSIVAYLRPDYRANAQNWVLQTWNNLSNPATKPVATASKNPPAKLDAPLPAISDPAIPIPVVPPKIETPIPTAPETIPETKPAPVAETPIIAPNNLSLDQAIDQARELRIHALDAEARQDYRTAIMLYGQIRQLPRDAWPADLELRAENARKHVQ